MSAPVAPRTLSLPASEVDALSPTARRVWVALVMRHRILHQLLPVPETLWAHADGMNAEDLAQAASVHPETFQKWARMFEGRGWIRVRQRWVSSRWDGDPEGVSGEQTPWHQVRLSNLYEIQV